MEFLLSCCSLRQRRLLSLVVLLLSWSANAATFNPSDLQRRLEKLRDEALGYSSMKVGSGACKVPAIYHGFAKLYIDRAFEVRCEPWVRVRRSCTAVNISHVTCAQRGGRRNLDESIRPPDPPALIALHYGEHKDWSLRAQQLQAPSFTVTVCTCQRNKIRTSSTIDCEATLPRNQSAQEPTTPPTFQLFFSRFRLVL